MNKTPLAALAIIAGTVVFAPAQPASAYTPPVTCQTKRTAPDSATLYSGPVTNRRAESVLVGTTVLYERCLNKLGPDWIRIISTRTTVFQDRKPHCSVLGLKGYDHTNVSTVFVSPTGKLFRGPNYNVPCKKGSFVTVTRSHSAAGVPQMYPVNTHTHRIVSPKIRISYKMDYRGGYDGHANTLSTVRF